MIIDYDRAIGEKIGVPIEDDNIRELFDIEGDAPEAELSYTQMGSVDAQRSSMIRVHEDNVIDAQRSSRIHEDDEIVVAATNVEKLSHGWESARVKIPRGDGTRGGTVRRKKRDHNGDVVGSFHSNPILDTTIYEVEMDDGMLEEVSSNVIAQAIYEDTDNNGFNRDLILEEIVDHFVSRKLTKKRSTEGWYLLVKWKGQGESVVRLADIKESYPVQVAEYAVANELEEEEAFWWVNYTLKKAERIMAKVRARNVRLEKFGVKIPRSVKEALEFDKLSGTRYWKEAIDLELQNIAVAFKFLEKDAPVPVGYQFISCHFIFDVKLDGTRKARYVAGGHMTEAPSSITYASVVSRDSIRILLVIAALNGLEVSSCDIRNAYINAKPRERVYFRAGPESGSMCGRLVIIVRALYGLKSSGAAFRARLAGELREMGYKPSLADPDVYMKPRIRSDGSTFWEYLLVYVDDILCISDDPTIFMTKISSIFVLKNGHAQPKTFLGIDVHRYEFEDNGETRQCWGFSSKSYIDRAVKSIEEKADKYGLILPKNVATPLRSSYNPELDLTMELNEDGVNFYQSMIGILRWLVEAGRIDISHSVSVMSSFMACPRIGQLVEVLHIFAYLKLNNNRSLVLNPCGVYIRRNLTGTAEEWKDIYPDAEERIPENLPEARGLPVTTHCFCDSDWAGNLMNRRSHSGLILFVQGAPVVWISKKQSTVETSSYGAELCAGKLAVEQIEALRYKLRMFGIDVLGPTALYIDNQSFVNNLWRPESTVKKKHLSISFHRTRESIASGMVEAHKIDSEENTADLLTKVLSGASTEYHVSNLLSCI